MTKAKLTSESRWESHLRTNYVRFDEIPVAMEHYMNDFNKMLVGLGWKIISIDMQPGNNMLIKLKEVNGK